MKVKTLTIEMEVEDIEPFYTTNEIRDKVYAAIESTDLVVKKLAIREMINSECTCPSTCKTDCRGQCGCKHCHDAYQDFLSLE